MRIAAFQSMCDYDNLLISDAILEDSAVRVHDLLGQVGSGAPDLVDLVVEERLQGKDWNIHAGAIVQTESP